MSYIDQTFLLTFLAIWGCALLLRKWPKAKEWLLILFSFFIIATWGYYDCLLFLGIILINYAGIHFMRVPRSPQAKRLLVGLLIFDVACLGFFKYSGFVTSNIGSLTGFTVPRFQLGVPVAISFYTFHLISLLVDSYTGKIQRLNFRAYLFYLSFFPHVIAGPIIRAWQLTHQIGKVQPMSRGLVLGTHFFITGFFLKVILADNIAIGIDDYWANANGLGMADRWCMAFLFYCQIYGDFAGYSLMAIGMARLLGYHFPTNFRSPMTACTLREFWQRWHISLSKFLRDYLYIPLGGNRGPGWRRMGTIMATMLLGGLWHGPSWNFVIWGGIHGLGILTERTTSLWLPRGNIVSVAVSFLFTQTCVLLAWVFFREADTVAALNFVRGMFVADFTKDMLTKPALLGALVFSIPIVIHNLAPRALWKISKPQLVAALGVSTAVMLVLNIVVLTKSSVFIYFKF